MSEYKVESNYCNCHPETCCCHDYNIVSEIWRVAAGSNKAMMQMICDDANANSTLRAQNQALREALEAVITEYSQIQDLADMIGADPPEWYKKAQSALKLARGEK